MTYTSTAAEQVWAIAPSALRMAMFDQGLPMVAPRQLEFEPEAGVVILELDGVLRSRSRWWGGSYESLANALEAAAADPSVSGVLLRVDSPGGQAAGVETAAQAIERFRKVKPIAALIDPIGASAAYWIAAATGRVLAAPGAMTASIGVVMAHVDRTKQLRAEGLKITHVTSGPRKVEMSPDVALTDDARARMQRMVDERAEAFFGAVAKYRGLDPEAVAALEGELMSAEAALEAGLVDGLATLAEAVAEVEQMAQRRKPKALGSGMAAAAAEDDGGREMESIDTAAGANGATEQPAAAAKAPAPSTNEPGPVAAPPARASLEDVAQAMATCGLNDLGLATSIQMAAATRADAVEIAQTMAILKTPAWAREALANGTIRNGAALRAAALERQAAAADEQATNSSIVGHEGLRVAPEINLLAAADKLNAEIEAGRNARRGGF